MKKLSLIVVLILCITIGGVYATWNYARYTVDSKQASATAVITGTHSSAKGVISLATDVKRVIVDDTNNDFTAEVFFGQVDANSQIIEDVTDANGEITITFTANAGADESVLQSGIPLLVSVTANKLGTYLGADVFEIKTQSYTIQTSEFAKASDASIFTTTINLKDFIGLKNEVVLDTYAEYQAFEAAITGITFTVTVSEYVGA